jgi:hypothetical protein
VQRLTIVRYSAEVRNHWIHRAEDRFIGCTVQSAEIIRYTEKVSNPWKQCLGQNPSDYIGQVPEIV